jgi:two-component system, LytTR family, response regulator
MKDSRPDRADADVAPVSVLIVDDERPARRKLRRLLDAAPGVTKILEAASGRLALDVIEDEEPDVIFLDVRMPGMDGFQLLDSIGSRADTQIVFVTAYDEHAVRAFDVRAADYLLKPFDEDRFTAALERARDAVAIRRAAAAQRTVMDVLAAFRHAVAPDNVARLLVDVPGGRRVLLPLERVVRIEAERNDAVFHADNGIFRLRTTLAELEAKLDPDRFLRINRSEIINLDRVTEIEPLDHGDARIHMHGGDIRRMSRRFRARMARFG